MFATRGLVVMSMLFFSSTALAHDQNADDQGCVGPKVYQAFACLNPHCYMEAATFGYPNDVDYNTYATLTLPAGSYLLQGKLSAYSNTDDYQAGSGNLECYLGIDPYGFALPAGQQWYQYTDWASVVISGNDQRALSMAVAVKLTVPATVGIGCRLSGYFWDSQWNLHLFKVNVWGARLIAESVGPVVWR